MAGPLVAAAVGAGIGAAGSIFSGQQASKFAERAYKHRYQWQVKDMQKAGLNPMLAFQNSAPNVPQPNFPDAGKGAMEGMSHASSARVAALQMKSQVALQDAQIRKTDAETALTLAQKTQLEGIGAAKIVAETGEINQRIAASGQQMLHTAELINKARTENAQYALMLQLERELKKATADGLRAQIPMKDLLGQIATIAANVLGSIQDRGAQTKAQSIFKDTVNMLEDKAGHSREALRSLGKDTWNYILDMPRRLHESQK